MSFPPEDTFPEAEGGPHFPGRDLHVVDRGCDKGVAHTHEEAGEIEGVHAHSWSS